MALRNIVTVGDPILNKKCRTVTKFDDRLATLLDVLGSALAYIGYYDGLRRIGATRAGVFIALNPLTAVICAYSCWPALAGVLESCICMIRIRSPACNARVLLRCPLIDATLMDVTLDVAAPP